jgi:hypothetical protein
MVGLVPNIYLLQYLKSNAKVNKRFHKTMKPHLNVVFAYVFRKSQNLRGRPRNIWRLDTIGSKSIVILMEPTAFGVRYVFYLKIVRMNGIQSVLRTLATFFYVRKNSVLQSREKSTSQRGMFSSS